MKQKKARRDVQKNLIYTNLKHACAGIGKLNTK